MYKIDSPGSVNGAWVNVDAVGGIPGTETDDEWLNTLQDELINVQEHFGVMAAKGPNNQVITALLTQAMVGGQKAINLVSDTDYTLVTATLEQKNAIFVFTDTGVVLTATRKIIVPDEVRLYLIENKTAQTLVIKSATGNGLQLRAGHRLHFYCDGIDILNSQIGQFAPDKSQWPTISNGADFEHDITFNPGKILSEDGNHLIDLVAPITKQGLAVWAEGDNQGGVVGGGVIVPNKTYHMKLIVKNLDGKIDAIMDPLVDGTNVPDGWTAFRSVGFRFTEAAANFTLFEQTGDYFNELTRLDTLFATAPSTTGTLETALPATGLTNIIGNFFMDLVDTASNKQAWLRAENEVNDLPSLANNDIRTSTSISALAMMYKLVRLNAFGQVRYRVNISPVTDFNIKLTGYFDPREKP